MELHGIAGDAPTPLPASGMIHLQFLKCKKL